MCGSNVTMTAWKDGNPDCYDTQFVVLIAHNPEIDQLYPSKVEPCSALRTSHGCGSSVIIRNKTSTSLNCETR